MPCPAAHLQPTKTPTGGHPAPALHIYTCKPKTPRPPTGPPLASAGRRALGAMGSWVYIGAREKARPDPALGRTRTGRFIHSPDQWLDVDAVQLVGQLVAVGSECCPVVVGDFRQLVRGE